MFKTKSQHMANDGPPVRGSIRKHFVLQVGFLVFHERKEKSDVGDKSPRYRPVATTENLSQAPGLVISY